VPTWKLFSQLSAPLIAALSLAGCSHYSFQPAAHASFLLGLFTKRFSYLAAALAWLEKRRRCRLPKVAAAHRGVGGNSLANETAVLRQKLFTSVSNVGKEMVGWAAIIRTVDLFVAVLTCSCTPNSQQLQLG
jgi:hypothetical protein